jgi:quercetin dioxygenase-like cupin family protein
MAVERRHLVRKVDERPAEDAGQYAGHSKGFSRSTLVGEANAVHTGFGVCDLEPNGSVDWHVHAYEESFFVLSGKAVLETDDGAFLLRPGDYGVIPVGAAHCWQGDGAQTARWADMLAPQPRSDRQDTFFVESKSSGFAAVQVDPRDPRTRSFGHIDPQNMDVGKQTQDQLALSASMRTALLVYSGITVKMMVDTDLGAELLTMFMVQYEPGGKAGAHDHPLEETYLILEGEVEGTFDGERYLLGPGDVAWAGVGCVHVFANHGPGIVRWLETQAPQPPSRHSYRFTRDWEYLRASLGER